MRASMLFNPAGNAAPPTPETPVMLPTPDTVDQMRADSVPGVVAIFRMTAEGEPITVDAVVVQSMVMTARTAP